MFCNQCEQTAQGIACTKSGVCGKGPEPADLQDLIVYSLRGLALAALKAREHGRIDPDTDHFSAKALFRCLTNVNFDPQALDATIREVVRRRNALLDGLITSVPYKADEPMLFEPAADRAGLLQQAAAAGLEHLDSDPDIASLRRTLLFGLKGVAAYLDHAAVLGQNDATTFALFHEYLAAGYDGVPRKLDDWLALCLDCGRLNLKAMELLDAGNTGTYGHPTPTPVPLYQKKGKAILVSGHDLKDLYNLLKATEGLGINVYTHGEMLPAHGYPKLHAFKHLAGHYGTAWQNQQKELPHFPGPVLFTTNCIMRPLNSYQDHVFTTGEVGFPGLVHVANGDFSAVIGKALEMPGFAEDGFGDEVLTGCGRNAVLALADKVIAGVKTGAIRHFFLVGGCDGAKPGRNYYTEFVEKTPPDTLVLTLACGKFRFFDKKLGDIDGIPRLLDCGQCNDAYSAIQIALALAKAFATDVNGLPLSLVLSWYEQKAVAILLTLLALGIKNIRLGPSLPAFLTPNVLDVLVRNYDLKPLSTPEEDLAAILG